MAGDPSLLSGEEMYVQLLAEEAVIPSRKTAGSAGYDLSAAADASIPARGRVAIPIGIAVAIPSGCYGRIAGRSSLAVAGIDVAGGVIDSDYRGEVSVILTNATAADVHITKGQRIAQLIVECIRIPPVIVVDDLDQTSRGEGGFGSTGA